MENRNAKKGFTLVELLVTISILATLTTVTVVSYTSFTKKAKVSNDISLVAQLNDFLKASEVEDGKPKTPSEVLLRLKETGIEENALVASAKKHQILWNQEDDSFVLMNQDTLVYGEKASQNYYYWKFIEEREENSPYSLYLKGNTFSGDFHIQAGLDVGKNTEISNIYYENVSETKQGDVIISTTNENYGTYLEVNGPLDTLSHYGYLSSLYIKSVANDSYHEYGKILGEVKVDNGHFILEDGSVLHGNVTSSDDANMDLDKGIRWSAPTYTWSEDNLSCTAYRYDINHLVDDEVETVASYLKEEEKETCTQDGHQILKAEFKNPVFVSQEKTIVLPKHDHQIEILEAVPATCVKTGLTEGKKCSECGYILLAQQETPIDSNNHHRDHRGFCVDCEHEMAEKEWEDVSILDYSSPTEIKRVFEENDYIYLQSDITFGIDSTIQIPVGIKGEKIINLNGHTIKIDKLSGTPSFKATGNNITFMNGKIESNYTSTIVQATGKNAHLTLENMEIVSTNSQGNCVKADSSGVIEIKNSKIITPASNDTRTAITVLSGLDSAHPCKIIVFDSEISGNIECLGGPANGGNIEIHRSTVDGTLLSYGDNATITSSEIKGKITARSGDTSISDSTISSLEIHTGSDVKVNKTIGNGNVDVSGANAKLTLTECSISGNVSSSTFATIKMQGGNVNGTINASGSSLEINSATVTGKVNVGGGNSSITDSLIASLEIESGHDAKVEKTTIQGDVLAKGTGTSLRIVNSRILGNLSASSLSDVYLQEGSILYGSAVVSSNTTYLSSAVLEINNSTVKGSVTNNKAVLKICNGSVIHGSVDTKRHSKTEIDDSSHVLNGK